MVAANLCLVVGDGGKIMAGHGCNLIMPIYNYFVEDKLLFPKQFGFQINTSTEHAILKLVRNVTKSFENNEHVLGVCIDLKKAFETVKYEILLHKLKLYGINGACLGWLKSYLSNRNQCTVYDA